MDAELAAYDAMWETTPKATRNAIAQGMADAYVAAHPELEADLGGFTVPELVGMTSAARKAGNDEQRILLDIYLMAAFENRHLSGAFDVRKQIKPPPLDDINGTRRKFGG